MSSPFTLLASLSLSLDYNLLFSCKGRRKLYIVVDLPASYVTSPSPPLIMSTSISFPSDPVQIKRGNNVLKMATINVLSDSNPCLIKRESKKDRLHTQRERERVTRKWESMLEWKTKGNITVSFFVHLLVIRAKPAMNSIASSFSSDNRTRRGTESRFPAKLAQQ